MIGMDSLLALRKRGVCPSIVEIDCDIELWTGRPGYDSSGWLHMLAGPSDQLWRVDWRPLFGVPWVQVIGLYDVRVMAVHAWAVKAGAKRVTSSVLKRRGDEFEVTRTEDTEGVLTWRA